MLRLPKSSFDRDTEIEQVRMEKQWNEIERDGVKARVYLWMKIKLIFECVSVKFGDGFTELRSKNTREIW